MKYQEGQRVKAKPGKVFRRTKYGNVTASFEGPGYCAGSGELTTKGAPMYFVSFNEGASQVSYSEPFLSEVKSGPKHPFGVRDLHAGQFYKGKAMSRRITKITSEKVIFDETLGLVVYPGTFCTPKEFVTWVKKHCEV